MIPGVILYLLTQKVLRSTYKKQNLEETIKLAFAVLLEVCGYSLLSMLKYNTVHYVLDILPGFAQICTSNHKAEARGTALIQGLDSAACLAKGLALGVGVGQ